MLVLLASLSYVIRNEASASETNLWELSLEELGRVQITSVSRKSESLSGAAAAVHVVTQEEIRRSGVNLIPEALRMVPGLEVARANARQWAISARGFNGVFANKLLVLMDGRTLYTPLFSGVFWEETDAVLEDIDRIEVIRGPGATLWGANAVNGVINIITKSAKETQGTLVSGGGGLEERGFGTVRYGGQFSPSAHYRVYTKYSNRDELTLSTGGGSGDSWWLSQTGFRVDWDPNPGNHLTLQGDYYYGDYGANIFKPSFSPPGVFPAKFRSAAEGGNVLGRWTHTQSEASEFSVQMFYDRAERGFGLGEEVRDTFDLDAQHRLEWGERQEIVWGAGYRYSVDHITQSPDFIALDPKVGLQLFSLFLQDEIALVPDRLHLTLGTKAEHNDFTEFEIQPSARMAWTLSDRQTVWSAVSRAVRTPARAERGFQFYVAPPASLPAFPLPILILGKGNPEFGSEEMISYELGYRAQIHSRLSLEAAAFYSEYDNLWAATALEGSVFLTPEPHFIIPASPRNDISAESYGGELSITWQPFDAWKWRGGYSILKVNMHTEAPVRSLTEESENDTANHQFFIWSDAEIGPQIDWGIGLRYSSARSGGLIPAYTALETKLAWSPRPNFELALIGRDLLDPHHQEAAPLVIGINNIEVDRAIYGKLTIRF